MSPPKDPIKFEAWKEKQRIVNTGRKMSLESNIKKSLALKGKPKSPEHKRHMSEALSGKKHPFFGKPRSDETKNKIKCSNQISCRTEKFRDAISERTKGEQNPQFGKPLSETTKQKIAISLKKYYSSPGTREKLSASHKGFKHSESSKLRLSEMRKGENNPCWRGGHAYDPYCPKFNREFKERVRAFFDYVCQVCGQEWQYGKKKLAVHHINYNKESCCANNVIPLFVPVCTGKCHAKTNHNRHYWEQYFMEIINTKYEGKCYFTKEEFEVYRIDKI